MREIRDLIERRFPGFVVEDLHRIGVDDGAERATTKSLGYGELVRIAIRAPDGTRRALVLHTAKADDFGHDRRADRAAAMLLAYDTYRALPGHVPAVDVGVVDADGTLRSLADTGEPYLVTEWVDGEPYATDLRRIVTEGAGRHDLHRVDVLADYLTHLHVHHTGRLANYARAVRDLVGSGEGIFGMIDGYPADVPGAPAARLRRLEERALDWRWRLRAHANRVTRIHGDFHPWNLLFKPDDELALVDASRGGIGDAADDVTALAINYVFFALDVPGAWGRGLGALWHRLWGRYLRGTGDRELLAVAAPWLAWRALVIANPRWYPQLSARGRDALLGWVERALDAPRFEPASADEVAP